MNREEANYYLKSSGFSDEQIDTIAKAYAEPKTGYREYNDIYDHYLCGNCKTVVMDYDNFCPNCGCRMVEPQESEDKE